MTRNTTAGLTLIEVLVALLLLALLTAVLSTTFVSSLRTNAAATSRTKASQLLSAISERVAQHQLLVGEGQTRYFVYTPDSTTVVLATSTPITDCDTYLASSDGQGKLCALVSNTETFNPVVSGESLLTSDARLYTVRIYWKDQGVSRNIETKSIY